jgi:hypothetical protein
MVVAKDHGCLANVKRKGSVDPKIILCMVLLTIGERRLFPPNLNLFLEISNMDRNHGCSIHYRERFSLPLKNVMSRVLRVFTKAIVEWWPV